MWPPWIVTITDKKHCHKCNQKLEHACTLCTLLFNVQCKCGCFLTVTSWCLCLHFGYDSCSATGYCCSHPFGQIYWSEAPYNLFSPQHQLGCCCVWTTRWSTVDQRFFLLFFYLCFHRKKMKPFSRADRHRRIKMHSNECNLRPYNIIRLW